MGTQSTGWTPAMSPPRPPILVPLAGRAGGGVEPGPLSGGSLPFMRVTDGGQCTPGRAQGQAGPVQLPAPFPHVKGSNIQSPAPAVIRPISAGAVGGGEHCGSLGASRHRPLGRQEQGLRPEPLHRVVHSSPSDSHARPLSDVPRPFHRV